MAKVAQFSDILNRFIFISSLILKKCLQIELIGDQETCYVTEKVVREEGIVTSQNSRTFIVYPDTNAGDSDPFVLHLQVCQSGGHRAEDGHTTLESSSFPLEALIIWCFVSSCCSPVKSVHFIRNDFYNLKEKYVPETEFPVAGVRAHLGADATSLYFSTAKTPEQRQVTGANPRFKQKIRESPGGGEQERGGCGQRSIHGGLR